MIDGIDPFKAHIVFSGKIPSVNNMYGTRRGGGKYLLPSVKSYKDMITINMIKQGCKKYFKPLLTAPCVLEVKIVFVFKTSFFKRDCTNMIKATEDAISDSIGIDDVYNMSLSSSKLNNNIDKYEHILISVEPFDKDSYLLDWGQHSG